MIFVKVVNAAVKPQPVHIKISGLSEIEPNGEIVEMKSENNEETNSTMEPIRMKVTTAARCARMKRQLE